MACVEMAGVYPPETLTLVGSERIAVPYTSWECTGYNQDTFEDDLPIIAMDSDLDMVIEVDIRDGAQLEIRAVTPDDQVRLDVHPHEQPIAVTLPDGTESVFIRLCTGDGRCANYEADIQS